jgi:Fic family protein
VKPPYELTPEIISLIAAVSEKTGAANALQLARQSPTLRKQNKIKTIQATLSIEGNTLSEKQITAIINNKRVAGNQKDLTEVLNAIQVYKEIRKFQHTNEKDFLRAHKMLMKDLLPHAGKYRTKNVGIVKGEQVAHIAPPGEHVPFLMKNLFQYLKNDTDLPLIKSCVFHYEIEFIHPFMDGNGRMGRLWQTLILMKENPLFEFLPLETFISKNQHDYYRALSISDKQGKSTEFIVFMLTMMHSALTELLKTETPKLSKTDRLDTFLETCEQPFTRKDYMKHFPELSTATASRDLKEGVDKKLIDKFGDKKTTYYQKREDTFSVSNTLYDY